jgi:hypothetical protein
VKPLDEPAHDTDELTSAVVRDPLALTDTVLAARRRPMGERLEVALSWNAVAAELRSGLLAVGGRTDPGR